VTIVTPIVSLVTVQMKTTVFLVMELILKVEYVTINVLRSDIMKMMMNGHVKHVTQLVLLVIVEIATVVPSVMTTNTYMKTLV